LKILIAGAGAMGCLFGCYLSSQPENEVCFFDKDKTRAGLIKSKGLDFTGLTKKHVPPNKILFQTNPLKIGVVELIIIFVKSYNTGPAVKQSVHCMDTTTVVLTLQNGLNNLQLIRGSLPLKLKNNVIAGVTAQGATLVQGNVINHAGIGETVIGKDDKTRVSDETVKLIAGMFNKTGLKTRISSDIESDIWSKLVLNSAINPLGAVYKLKNGDLCKFRHVRGLLYSVVKESAAVANAKGVKLAYPDPVKKVVEVCTATKNNINSMYQDILNHKKTEINQINGAIIKEGKKLGLHTPLNVKMYNIIRKLEAANERAD
jgi:2-dehydropantoate 2-reductase